MWYILEAKAGAKLIYGLKEGTTESTLARAIENSQLELYLNEVEVKKGDIFFIPAGTVHAIGEGILLAEIQQNSDTTYRLYDWNRKGEDGTGRELHIEKALAVIDFNKKINPTHSRPLTIKDNGYTRVFLAACPYFVTEKINTKNGYRLNLAGERFYILINLTEKEILSMIIKIISSILAKPTSSRPGWESTNKWKSRIPINIYPGKQRGSNK